MDTKFSIKGWGDPTHKVTWHFDIVVTWQIKNVISLLSQGLWTPNLVNWWLRMRGRHPQSQVTLQYRGHATNRKRYISTFTRPMHPKLNGVGWLLMRGPHQQNHVTHQLRGHFSSQNVLSPHSQGPRPPKLASVLNQDEGAPPKKLRDTSIVWLREKSKPSYFLNHRDVEM